MFKLRPTLRLIAAVAGLAAGGFSLLADEPKPLQPAKPGSSEADFFESKIRPLFANRCAECHGEKKQEMGLRVDKRDAFFKGGDGGPVVVPGEPEKSPLIDAVKHTGDYQMPPNTKLPDEEIAALTNWIKLGAPWPEDRHAADSGLPSTADAAKNHWAYQPVVRPPVPEVKNGAWAKTPIDRFILAGLEAAGLEPSPAADCRTLIRRATFDLIGLPPTPEEIEAFVADDSPDAFARLVDRLLESPHYGERWGRYWLDLARYADNKGYAFAANREYYHAYNYRDWVVQSLNEDLPYDQFVLQQIAADLLERNSDSSLAALGFLTLGRRFLNNKHDIIDDRLDVIFRGTQGLTVSCARCHDHKYDPIPTADYYALYGVLDDTVEATANLETPSDEYVKGLAEREEAVKHFITEQRAAVIADLKAKGMPADKLSDADFRVVLPEPMKKQLKELEDAVKNWTLSDEAPRQAHVLYDKPPDKIRRKAHIFVRGNPNNRGKAVPKQFPAVVAGADRKPFTEGSGRLEMARFIASRENPLTARVIVNRVWMQHFGAPLVATPSDFGVRSEPPTHPELLDFLADQFMADGWSLKRLHRRIMLSAAYQQSCADRPEAHAVDPANRLVWKMNRRRLDWEAMRDSIAFVSGSLDLTVGGKAVDLFAPPPKVAGSGVKKKNAKSKPEPVEKTRRTLYGYIDRQNLPGVLRTFDFALPDTHSPARYSTTVPSQALYWMNSDFVVEHAKRLVEREPIASAADDAQRLQTIYNVLFGRPATKKELALSTQFLEQASNFEDKLGAWQQLAQALLMTNEFTYVE